MEATLCIHTCLWLSAAWVPLASPDGAAGGGERADTRLTWAVSLDAPEEEMEARAEELARSAGLLNMGRVGELRGHYLFAYRPEGRAASEHEAVRRSVDTLFAQHDSVRWHSEQKLLKRSKRSLHFNDPKYPQQWHLVSGCPLGQDFLSRWRGGGTGELLAWREEAAPCRWCWGGQGALGRNTLSSPQERGVVACGSMMAAPCPRQTNAPRLPAGSSLHAQPGPGPARRVWQPREPLSPPLTRSSAFPLPSLPFPVRRTTARAPGRTSTSRASGSGM